MDCGTRIKANDAFELVSYIKSKPMEKRRKDFWDKYT